MSLGSISSPNTPPGLSTSQTCNIGDVVSRSTLPAGHCPWALEKATSLVCCAL
jgi:hypothetical protein